MSVLDDSDRLRRALRPVILDIIRNEPDFQS